MDWIQSSLETACPFIRRVKKFYSSDGLPVYQLESHFWNDEVKARFDVFMFSYSVSPFVDDLGCQYVRLFFNMDY